MVIVSASDKYMIRFMISDTENGLYSMATRILHLSQLYPPYSFKHGSFPQSQNIIQRILKGSTLLSLMHINPYFISVQQVFCSSPYSDCKGAFRRFSRSIYLRTLLIIAVLMSCLCQFLSSIYSATKNTS